MSTETVTITNETRRQYHLPPMNEPGSEKRVAPLLPERGRVGVPRWYFERLVRDFEPWKRRLGSGTVVHGTRADRNAAASALRRARQADNARRTAETRAQDLEAENERLKATLEALRQAEAQTDGGDPPRGDANSDGLDTLNRDELREFAREAGIAESLDLRLGADELRAAIREVVNG